MRVAAAPRRDSLFLRRVRAAVLLDLDPELVLCEKVAVLQAAGYRHHEIHRLLDVSVGELRLAEARVKKACERLDAGD